MDVDCIYLLRKYNVDNDPLIDLILKIDFLGLNINQYFLNKGIDKISEEFQSHIDFFDSENMLIITDKLAGQQFDQLTKLLIDTKEMYNKFYDND